MKYLYDHESTNRYLRVWSGNEPLVKASFYFWNPGQQMQKSLEGLLQTLLYHILNACPDLTPTMCSRRWDDQQLANGTTSTMSWTLAELQASFARFKTQPSVSTKFYFHIDGLDEYYGDSWDVIGMLRDLSTTPNVKLCLSSRPWNCFQDAFGTQNPHMLRLHDLTRQDIELFARENLLSYTHYLDLEPNLFDDLIRDIGDRAQGVFLWVRLVVRSLRDGIVNEDPVSILQERLGAIPSDLEEFFEHILASVEEIYRTRMASTFLAALRTRHPLKVIHYYFLEQDDTTFGLDLPSNIWRSSQIQRRVLQTQRRLNGRFKGLLEPASLDDIGPQTNVDFLHRTLRDFLATERMRKTLQSWASRELNVFTAISRALIAESKFIHEAPSPSALKVAVEIASQGAAETGSTTHCYEIITQAELANERIRPNHHSECGVNCYMLRFAAALGHADYLRHRVHEKTTTLNLDRILKHAIHCESFSEETYERCLPVSNQSEVIGQLNDWSLVAAHAAAPLPSLVTLLFSLGADPNTIVDGISSWTALIDETIELMDGEHKEQCWAVFDRFLEKGVDVNISTEQWHDMLLRGESVSHEGLCNTLRYFRRLFAHGLRPNDVSMQGTTLTDTLLKTLSQNSLNLSAAAQGSQCELLREFLRYGADVTRIYRDASSDGWFQKALHELHQSCTLTVISPRLAEFRVFLEHGLDPNASIASGRTVWEHVLSAINRGIGQGSSDRAHHQTIRHMIILLLQYGADPSVEKLQRVLLWMKSTSSLLSQAEVRDVEQAILDEIAQRNSQTPCPMNFKRDNLNKSSSAPINTVALLPTDAGSLSRHSQKRIHGEITQLGYSLDSKRVRFQ